MNIIFDMDDTLYDLMEPFYLAHKDLFASRLSIDPEELFKRSRVHSDIVLDAERRGKIDHKDSFHERIRRTYEEQGLEVTREETKVFEEKYRDYQTKISIYPHMKEVLDFCKEQGIAIGVLTNGPVPTQMRKLGYLNLSNWIPEDHLFISGATSFQKPEKELFDYVVENMQILPEETWYIGDTYEVDVVGAVAAGWHVIWYNHRKNPCPYDRMAADIELQNKEELINVLKDLVWNHQ